MPHKGGPRHAEALHVRPRRVRPWVPIVAGLVVVALVVTAIVVHSLNRPSATAPTVAPAASASSAARMGMNGRGVVGAVVPATPTATPRAESVAARIKAAGTAPGVLGIEVVDADSGAELHASGQNIPLAPASNLKVLTATALLDSTDAGHRYTTKVVAEGSHLTLVGGGDPYLKSKPSAKYPQDPSMQDLARRTASALRGSGTTSVTVNYDDSLFTGPNWNKAWPVGGYEGEVTPISALWIDEGMVANNIWARSKTPSVMAVNAFVSQLRSDGIRVNGAAANRRAGSEAKQIAAVSSAPVEDLVTRTLEDSDNSAAEVLSRQMALASGKPGSFEGAAAALHEHLSGMGAWQDGAVLQDGCGLSHGNRVTASMLTRTWQKVLTTPKLLPVANAVPVSRVSGTLVRRFDQPSTAAARGVVHAKTGTLDGVISMSGWVRDDDGRILVASFILNRTEASSAREWLDRAWAGLAGCGCSG